MDFLHSIMQVLDDMKYIVSNKTVNVLQVRSCLVVPVETELHEMSKSIVLCKTGSSLVQSRHYWSQTFLG